MVDVERGERREALVGPSGNTRMYLASGGITKTQLRRISQHETAWLCLFIEDRDCMINTSNTNAGGLGVVSFMLRNVDVFGPDRRLCMQ